MKILIAEDDPLTLEALEACLKGEGFETVLASNGAEAFARWKEGAVDLMCLDVMMPEMDGFAFAEQLRAQGDETPFIFLTARSMVEDRITGFKLGCDDYITKPFSMEELLLRIQAVLRRQDGAGAENVLPAGPVTIGSFVFNPAPMTLTRDSQAQRLTDREGELLGMLAAHLGQTLTREAALLAIWQDDSYHAGRSMDVFISKLRKHLSGDPNVEIRSVHGRGFRLLVHE